MQSFLNFVFMRAQYLGSIIFRPSIMKQIFLVFLMTVSFSQAIEWDNEVTIDAVCDNSTMHLSFNFTKAFQGTIYQYRGFYNPKCSYTVPFNTNITELDLSMPFGACEISIEELDNKTMASTEVVIQMHSLLDSIYDKTINVSCEIYNYHFVNETESEDYSQFQAQSLDHSWIEFKHGLVLFGEVGESTESSLYVVVNIRDDGSNQDMVVQNCVAHTDKNVTNTTTLLQLSNFYGCPDPSAILSNFTVMRPGSDTASMSAYAPIANFSVLASRGRMSISCGITVCADACPAHCNDTDAPVRLPLSDYVIKDVVTRGEGAVMPDSLRELNRHNDRSRRTPNRPKRSVTSFLSRIFHWESQIVSGPQSELNFTNVTSTSKAKGLVVKHTIVAKDVLVSSDIAYDVNTANNTSNLADQFQMDWKTFRFIALMAVCLFITVTASYCCYVDESKSKRNSGYVV